METTTQESSTYRTTQQTPIDRLFLRMASFYGKHWLDMWIDIPMDSVKAEWQAKLSGMPSKTVFRAVDYCADNVKFPPSLPEFMQLCKANTPSEITKALPRHFTDEELEANKKKLEKINSDLTRKSSRDWVRYWNTILDNPKGLQEITLSCAREALINLGHPYKVVNA